MQPTVSRIRACLLASVLACALSSCGRESPPLNVTPPADLLSRPDEPPMTADALTSEEAYERQRDAKIEWGRDTAGRMDRACWRLQDAGVKLDCRPR